MGNDEIIALNFANNRVVVKFLEENALMKLNIEYIVKQIKPTPIDFHSNSIKL